MNKSKLGHPCNILYAKETPRFCTIPFNLGTNWHTWYGKARSCPSSSVLPPISSWWEMWFWCAWPPHECSSPHTTEHLEMRGEHSLKLAFSQCSEAKWDRFNISTFSQQSHKPVSIISLSLGMDFIASIFAPVFKELKWWENKNKDLAWNRQYLHRSLFSIITSQPQNDLTSRLCQYIDPGQWGQQHLL